MTGMIGIMKHYMLLLYNVVWYYSSDTTADVSVVPEFRSLSPKAKYTTSYNGWPNGAAVTAVLNTLNRSTRLLLVYSRGGEC